MVLMLYGVYIFLIDATVRTELVKSKQNADIKGKADEYRDEKTAIMHEIYSQ